MKVPGVDDSPPNARDETTSTSVTSQTEAAPNASSSNSSNPGIYMTKNQQRANIIIFGESGAGKSSLVNMIAGTDCAQTSDDATGCTFASTPYGIDLPEHSLRIWDTAGLNEDSHGAIDFKTAVSNIYKLTRDLDGVNLFVYCVRSRITDNMVQNYKMLRAFCAGYVPIVLVITAMENCYDKDAWWEKNVAAFERAGIHVVGHVCVATLRQKGMEKEFMAWTEAVRRMIEEHYLRTPWVMEKDSWFRLAVTKLIEVLFDGPSNRSRQLYEGLIHTGFSKKDAQEAARAYDASSSRSKESKKVPKLRWLLPGSESPASISERV
ncbi:P-loop containing nucleoside triphosphate hydrolase protein [Athelia psychrophila]|uniref:P-loop containing nucleoside triphosphate hydrolase protein n=1 Tax=Athelia psychrophila TaxID=1759441 RepID=A0A166BSB0_9AGAM|nr:P-loop containing nucleoside triphosphate hydrolase protein [Fibularhizoctonia sp. CBS 109695]